MKQRIEFKLSPEEAGSVACDNARIEQALAYLAATVSEAGGVAELTILIQRRRQCPLKKKHSS